MGEIEEVKEERIEFICKKENIKVIKSMINAYPYEEVA